MESKQKKLMFAINLYVAVLLMWFITQVTKAYIGMAYPEMSNLQVSNLITLPNMAGLVFSFLIAPIALKFSKVKLYIVAILCVLGYCVIFYVNGLLHGPFWIYYVACFLAGFGQGAYVPLLNSIIGEHFKAEERGHRIANYNVWLSVNQYFSILRWLGRFWRGERRLQGA